MNPQFLVGKTIVAVDNSALNVLGLTFSTGEKINITYESAGLGLNAIVLEPHDEQSDYLFFEAQSKSHPNLVYLVKGRYPKDEFLFGAYKVLTFRDGSVNDTFDFFANGAFPLNEYNFKISDKTF